MKFVFYSFLVIAYLIVGIGAFVLGTYFYDYENKYLAGALSLVVIPLALSFGMASIFNTWFQKFNPKSKLHLLTPYFVTPIIGFWAIIMWGNQNGASEYLNCTLYGSVQKDYSLLNNQNIESKGYLSLIDCTANKNQFGRYEVIRKSKKGGHTTHYTEYIVFPILPINETDYKLRFFAAHKFSELNNKFNPDNYEIAMIDPNIIGGAIVSYRHDIDNYIKATKDYSDTYSVDLDDKLCFIIPSLLDAEDFIANRLEAFLWVIGLIVFCYLGISFVTIKFLNSKFLN